MEMILEKVKEIVAVQFNVEEGELDLDTSFKDTLNADSLDLVGLVMAFEDEFGLEVEDEDVESIKTIGDAVDYIRSMVEGE